MYSETSSKVQAHNVFYKFSKSNCLPLMVRRRTRFLSPSNATASTSVIEAVGFEMLDLLFTSAVAVERPIFWQVRSTEDTSVKIN
jgi:hypothetical protein